MAENNHQEFEGIAEYYNRHRPTYPEDILHHLQSAILTSSARDNRAQHPRVADIASGTGISTRLLRRYLGPDVELIGIEPGHAMQQQALEATPEDMCIQYINAQAEKLPFQNASISALVVAQAIQWFDRPAFYREANRVLIRHGVLAIMQNNRDWQQSPFLDAYETFLESNQEHYSRLARSFDIVGELKASGYFETSFPYRVTWERSMSIDAFIGFSLSSTRMKAVVKHLGQDRAVQKLRDLVQDYQDNEAHVVVRYVCELFLARSIDS